MEGTGLFTDATKARDHLHDTVKKVVISAPAKNEDATLVLGVNANTYDPAKHHVSRTHPAPRTASRRS